MDKDCFAWSQRARNTMMGLEEAALYERAFKGPTDRQAESCWIISQARLISHQTMLAQEKYVLVNANATRIFYDGFRIFNLDPDHWMSVRPVQDHPKTELFLLTPNWMIEPTTDPAWLEKAFTKRCGLTGWDAYHTAKCLHALSEGERALAQCSWGMPGCKNYPL